MLKRVRGLLLLSLLCRPAIAHDPSTFCLTAPEAGDFPTATTTLHQSSTSTEWVLATTEVVYTVTKQVPDHTITTHTLKTYTETLDYLETYTSTHWDGTKAETRGRPTITITLPLTLPPGATPPGSYRTREAEQHEPQPDDAPALVAKDGLDTVVCNTIFYSTGTLTLTRVTGVMNYGQPSRTITFVQTHTEAKTVFITPPARTETKTTKHLYLTYTTTFVVVTAGMPQREPNR